MESNEKNKQGLKEVHIKFNSRDWMLISKASAISSLNWTSFIRNSSIEKALELLKKWNHLPLDFYTEKEDSSQ